MSGEVRQGVTRRRLLGGLLAGGAALLAPPALAAYPPNKPRLLSFENLHTGEKLRKVPYWEGGRYMTDALSAINHILRDHRTNEVETIDPALLDQLYRLHIRLGSNTPFQVISAYRSARTNAMLHERSGGVARRSLHMDGKAIDIRLKDRMLIHIRNAALEMKSGGVGYYAESQFVHLDTGRVRSW